MGSEEGRHWALLETISQNRIQIDPRDQRHVKCKAEICKVLGGLVGKTYNMKNEGKNDVGGGKTV